MVDLFKKNQSFIIIALLSVTLISLEIVWIRIFSAEYFYNFAFLILSLSVMGLGLGGLSLRLFPWFNKEQRLGLFLSVTAIMALAGPVGALKINFEFIQLFSSWIMVGKFVLIIFILSSAFFSGGAALALLFRHHHQNMPRLYMFDLIGAGSGVLLAVLLMNIIGVSTKY